MAEEVLIVSDGELVILIALDNALRAAGNEYVRENGAEKTLTSHMVQVAIRISTGVHIFDDHKKTCGRARFRVVQWD